MRACSSSRRATREIGTLSGQQQFREAYQRAIYMHGGRSYRVKEVALTGSSGGEIVLELGGPLATDARVDVHVCVGAGHLRGTDDGLATARK